MTETLTFVTVAGLAVAAAWAYRRRIRPSREPIAVSVRLDRSTPGAHLIWEIANTARTPVALTELVVHGGHGAMSTVTLGLPHMLEAQDRLIVPTDVDWALLGARSIAVRDVHGREHHVPKRQLTIVQEHLREQIDRRSRVIPARDWLFGATDLAFGVAILGLGFFMLMWVIATG